MTRFMNSSNMETVKLSNFDNIRNLCIDAEVQMDSGAGSIEPKRLSSLKHSDLSNSGAAVRRSPDSA
jgi:hypothetical protein